MVTSLREHFIILSLSLAGGSFRHFLWQVCKELQSSSLSLLLLCPSSAVNKNKVWCLSARNEVAFPSMNACVQCQVEWGLGHPDLVSGTPACGRGLEWGPFQLSKSSLRLFSGIRLVQTSIFTIMLICGPAGYASIVKCWFVYSFFIFFPKGEVHFDAEPYNLCRGAAISLLWAAFGYCNSSRCSPATWPPALVLEDPGRRATGSWCWSPGSWHPHLQLCKKIWKCKQFFFSFLQGFPHKHSVPPTATFTDW